MLDDKTGKEIPFCKETYGLPITKGQEDLSEYVTLTITDKADKDKKKDQGFLDKFDKEKVPEIGQLRLKLSTLMGGGHPLAAIIPEHVPLKEQMQILKATRTEWYPLFSDLNQSPGQLLIKTQFVPDKRWEEKVTNKKKDCCSTACKSASCACCAFTCLCCTCGPALCGAYLQFEQAKDLYDMIN